MSASKELMDAICDGGTPVATCACGVTHFDANGEFMDEGELETLLVKQQANPEKYSSHDGSISFGHVAGQQYVWNCNCDRLDKCEMWLLENQRMILNFFRNRASKLKADAESAAESLKGIP